MTLMADQDGLLSSLPMFRFCTVSISESNAPPKEGYPASCPRR